MVPKYPFLTNFPFSIFLTLKSPALRLVIEFFCKVNAVVLTTCLKTKQYTTQQIYPAHSIITKFKTKNEKKEKRRKTKYTEQILLSAISTAFYFARCLCKLLRNSRYQKWNQYQGTLFRATSSYHSFQIFLISPLVPFFRIFRIFRIC